MTVHEAAKLLYKEVRDAQWFTMVGVGEQGGRPCIFLYVKSSSAVPPELVKNRWYSYPVVVRKMSTPRPIRTS